MQKILNTVNFPPTNRSKIFFIDVCIGSMDVKSFGGGGALYRLLCEMSLHEALRRSLFINNKITWSLLVCYCILKRFTCQWLCLAHGGVGGSLLRLRLFVKNPNMILLPIFAWRSFVSLKTPVKTYLDNHVCLLSSVLSSRLSCDGQLKRFARWARNH